MGVGGGEEVIPVQGIAEFQIFATRDAKDQFVFGPVLDHPQITQITQIDSA